MLFHCRLATGDRALGTGDLGTRDQFLEPVAKLLRTSLVVGIVIEDEEENEDEVSGDVTFP